MEESGIERRISDTETWRFDPTRFEQESNTESAATEVTLFTYKINALIVFLCLVFILSHLVFVNFVGLIALLPAILIGGYNIFYYFNPVTLSQNILSIPLWDQLQVDELSARCKIQSPLITKMAVDKNRIIFVSSTRSTVENKRLIIVSEKMFELLKPAEIRAVIAHELAHVKFNDVEMNRLITFIGSSILVSTVLSTLVSAVKYIFDNSSLSVVDQNVSSILIIGLISIGVFIYTSLKIKEIIEYRADMFSIKYTDAGSLYTSLASIKGINSFGNDEGFHPPIVNRMKNILEIVDCSSSELLKNDKGVENK